ncbi:hypothetical protein BN938_2832 [Mucinivorans hirudinis]|uniref:Uncharacterized protein n=1 Tax=Mucinivorans hirudinis TaxID=1433126 RepID=A0A060REA2_9BACT|nr:hypothetical protein BN938_2832 [Mucinivorans hirudinis]
MNTIQVDRYKSIFTLKGLIGVVKIVIFSLLTDKKVEKKREG